MSRITQLMTRDVRFRTSAHLDGSDAMNPDPDYSAAYVRLITDDPSDGERELYGNGFVFTIGRGNEIQVAAIESLRDLLVGQEVEPLLADMGSAWRLLGHDSQLRWLGPEKGVIHMAMGAVINALWDLKAKRAGLPLWELLATMEPEEIVAAVDFRYLSDALTPQEALRILRAGRVGLDERIAVLRERGYPAYTTTPGWLGYDDAKLDRLCKEAVSQGFTQIKLKVGAHVTEDRRRLQIARAAVGPDVQIAVDANQRWDVAEAIDWVLELGADLAWVEEPTSPDDVLGHATIARAIAPTPVATGEQMMNRVLAKQFLQAGALQVLQIDATRVGGVNENLAMLLLATKFGVRVCPHAGGVGLCETVQHLAMFDFVAVSTTTEGRFIEYVDHLHEHFVTPAVIRNGHYVAPSAPGAGTEMLPMSIAKHAMPRSR